MGVILNHLRRGHGRSAIARYRVDLSTDNDAKNAHRNRQFRGIQFCERNVMEWANAHSTSPRHRALRRGG